MRRSVRENRNADRDARRAEPAEDANSVSFGIHISKDTVENVCETVPTVSISREVGFEERLPRIGRRNGPDEGVNELARLVDIAPRLF